MPLIILAGAPSVGKSTVQNVALEQLQAVKPIKVATFGDYMFEMAKKTCSFEAASQYIVEKNTAIFAASRK